MNRSDGCARRAVPHAAAAAWVGSSLPGVQRRLPDRVGGEVARGAGLVRCTPGSHFGRHAHGGGEEILVLDGTLCADTGDHPAGTYPRSPRWSRHTPVTGSEGGLICVKVDHLGAGLLAPGAAA